MISSEIVRDGWNYTTLAEDRSFSADSIVQGFSVAYQHEAEFYDEQPTSMRVVWRQRIRWAKGHLQAFGQSGADLLRGIFGKNSAREKFMCYDMFMINFPGSVVLMPLKFLKLVLLVCAFLLYGIVSNDWPLFLFKVVQLLLFEHLANIPVAFLLFIMERKRIKPIKWYKKLFYCLTFPLFSIIGDAATYVAVFRKVSWKPIPHKAAVKIEELESAPGFKSRAPQAVYKEKPAARNTLYAQHGDSP